MLLRTASIPLPARCPGCVTREWCCPSLAALVQVLASANNPCSSVECGMYGTCFQGTCECVAASGYSGPSCSVPPSPVDASYGPWSDFGPCSLACGGGVQVCGVLRHTFPPSTSLTHCCISWLPRLQPDGYRATVPQSFGCVRVLACACVCKCVLCSTARRMFRPVRRPRAPAHPGASAARRATRRPSPLPAPATRRRAWWMWTAG